MPFDFRPLIKCSRVLSDLPLYFPALNIRLEPKCVPQFLVGSLLGTRWSAIGQFFPSPLQQSQKSLRRLTRPRFLSKVANWFCCKPDFAKKKLSHAITRLWILKDQPTNVISQKVLFTRIDTSSFIQRNRMPLFNLSWTRVNTSGKVIKHTI